MQNEGKQRKIALKVLIFEFGVIISFVIISIFTLSYLKIINLSPFFPWESVRQDNNLAPNNLPDRSTLLQTLSYNKALHTAYSVIEYEGTIRVIDIRGGIIPKSNLQYGLFISLNINNVNSPVPYYVGKSRMQNVQIFQRKKGKQIPMNISDLKPGDRVIMSLNTSLIQRYPDFLNQLTITKI